MTIHQLKAQYEAEFKSIENHISSLHEELQRAILTRELARGKYAAMAELEADEAPVGSPTTRDSNGPI